MPNKVKTRPTQRIGQRHHITRNLGVRAKVFALDRSRRLPRGHNDGNSIMERLSRTLSSRGPR